MNPFRQSSRTQQPREMSIDSEALAALVDKSVSESMEKSIELLKETLENSGRTQADSLQAALKGSVSEILTTVMKKHEEHEAKVEQRLQDQDTKNDKKFLEVRKEIADIWSSIGKTSSTQQVQHSVLSQQPRPSSVLPTPLLDSQPPVPSMAAQQQQQQHHSNQAELGAIHELVSRARTILGIGPICCEDIDAAEGDNDEQKLTAAVIDFLRNEIAIKECEIKDSDVLEVFPANDPDLNRVYVKFSTKEQAQLCLDLTRKLRKPELQVVLYIPREFKARFHAMKNEDYRLRKLTLPRHKTRIEYSDSDLVLYACQLGHFRYSPYPIPDLPAVDLTPLRSPPKGRKTKRPRDDSKSPPGADRKNPRYGSPSQTVSTVHLPPQPQPDQDHLNSTVMTKSS